MIINIILFSTLLAMSYGTCVNVPSTIVTLLGTSSVCPPPIEDKSGNVMLAYSFTSNSDGSGQCCEQGCFYSELIKLDSPWEPSYIGCKKMHRYNISGTIISFSDDQKILNGTTYQPIGSLIHGGLITIGNKTLKINRLDRVISRSVNIRSNGTMDVGDIKIKPEPLLGYDQIKQNPGTINITEWVKENMNLIKQMKQHSDNDLKSKKSKRHHIDTNCWGFIL
jgi:hypothetical protein